MHINKFFLTAVFFVLCTQKSTLGMEDITKKMKALKVSTNQPYNAGIRKKTQEKHLRKPKPDLSAFKENNNKYEGPKPPAAPSKRRPALKEAIPSNNGIAKKLSFNRIDTDAFNG